MAPAIVVRQVDAAGAAGRVSALAELLLDAVAGGASVSFLAGLTRDESENFWRGVAEQVARGSVELFVAERGERLWGTVQLVPAWQPNQQHRAEIIKLLVARSTRRRGIGTRLMQAAEERSRVLGRWLVTLDTLAESEAERFYSRLGYFRAGAVPEYARLPTGELRATAMMYKRLDPTD